MGAAATANGTRPKRKTWKDWMPEGTPEPEDLLTRDELIAELRRDGVAVGVEDLRNWQSAGTIPYGVRRWHDGATRVLYPRWMGQVVGWLRRLQDEGADLSEIGSRLLGTVRGELPPPGSATMSAGAGVAIATGPPAALTGGASMGTHHPLKASAEATARGSAKAISVALPEHLRPPLAAWARDYQQRVGTKIARVDVSLVDEQGRPLRFTFAVEPNEYRNNSTGVLESG